MNLSLRSLFKLVAPGFMISCLSVLAADYQVKTRENKVPDAVAPEIASTMSVQAYEIFKDEDLVYRFWFREVIPLSAIPEKAEMALDQFIQPSLIGVVEVPEESRDYRDDELFKNVFTMRYGLRPDDGNHLGTSDYRHFAVLIPADQDQTLNGIEGYKPLVKASSDDTISDHPVILSLRPADGDTEKLPSIQEPARHHHALRLELAGKVEKEEDKNPIVLEIVFEGYAEF